MTVFQILLIVAFFLLCALLVVGIMIGELSGFDFVHFLIGIIAVISLFFAFGCVAENDSESIPVECQEIKSFALHSEISTSTSGAFYLGCGYVASGGSTEMKYYFYKKGQVGYVLCSISASRVELVETDEKPPGIEGIFTDSGDIKVFENYVIYVPTGTIFEEYKVEL